MPALWKWGRHEKTREPLLVPLSAKSAAKSVALANLIPGTQVDEDTGEVAGAPHALGALIKAADEALNVERSPLRGGSTWTSKLPEFQFWGHRFIASNLETGVLVNDDMGLGKTVQTIAAMSLADSKAVKVVLCPAFLRPQWRGEIEKWAPVFNSGGSTAIVWPKASVKSKVKMTPGMYDWVIAYYLDYERAIDLVGDRPYYLVVDEIHNIRGYGTKRLESVGALTTFSAGRVGLTGSKLYNDGRGMYPMLNLVQPGAWGWFGSFASRYCSGFQDEWGGWKTGKLSNVDELRYRMEMMSYRRTRAEVAQQLPFDTKYQTLWLDAPPGAAAGLKAAWQGGLAGMSEHLRRVNSVKTPAVIEQVNSDNSAGIPSLTVTWLREHAQELAASITGSMLVMGGADSTKRLDRITEYVKKCQALKQTPCLVATMDSIGEGANLQWAKAVNVAALDYTPDKLRQVIARAARMGQTGEVLVRIFGVRGTIDEHYMRVLKEKLTEQFRLEGKREADKGALFDALGTKAVKDALKEMYERMVKEEKSGAAA